MHYLTITKKYMYPLHHVTYAPAKFEVAICNSLGEDTITRNVTDTLIEDGPNLVQN